MSGKVDNKVVFRGVDVITDSIKDKSTNINIAETMQVGIGIKFTEENWKGLQDGSDPADISGGLAQSSNYIGGDISMYDV